MQYGSSPESSTFPISDANSNSISVNKAHGHVVDATNEDSTKDEDTRECESSSVGEGDDEKTEHGDTQSGGLKFDILDYLESPVADPARIPNALSEVACCFRLIVKLSFTCLILKGFRKVQLFKE